MASGSFTLETVNNVRVRPLKHPTQGHHRGGHTHTHTHLIKNRRYWWGPIAHMCQDTKTNTELGWNHPHVSMTPSAYADTCHIPTHVDTHTHSSTVTSSICVADTSDWLEALSPRGQGQVWPSWQIFWFAVNLSELIVRLTSQSDHMPKMVFEKRWRAEHPKKWQYFFCAESQNSQNWLHLTVQLVSNERNAEDLFPWNRTWIELHTLVLYFNH